MDYILDIITDYANKEIETLAFSSNVFFINTIYLSYKKHVEYISLKKNAFKLKYIKELCIIGKIPENYINLISKMKNIKRIYIRLDGYISTNIMSSCQNIIDKYPSLEWLYVNNYDIKLNLDKNTKIKYLDCNFLFESINNLHNLEYINCPLNFTDFYYLKNLKKIVINHICNITDCDISGLKKLEYLTMPLNNNIFDLKENSSLKELTLSASPYYNFEKCADLIKYNNIESLIINKNFNSDTVWPDFNPTVNLNINNFDRIKKLSLNVCCNVVEYIKYMINLEDLRLNNYKNNIDLNNNRKLRFLSLNNNDITNNSIESLENLEVCEFNKCCNLTEIKYPSNIRVLRNRFGHISNNNVNSMINLEILDIEFNNTIKNIDNLKKLKMLYNYKSQLYFSKKNLKNHPNLDQELSSIYFIEDNYCHFANLRLIFIIFIIILSILYIMFIK